MLTRKKVIYFSRFKENLKERRKKHTNETLFVLVGIFVRICIFLRTGEENLPWLIDTRPPKEATQAALRDPWPEPFAARRVFGTLPQGKAGTMLTTSTNKTKVCHFMSWFESQNAKCVVGKRVCVTYVCCLASFMGSHVTWARVGKRSGSGSGSGPAHHFHRIEAFASLFRHRVQRLYNVPIRVHTRSF